eukprot:11900955-Alexandrium_andersonii.AAC.1
MSPVDALDPACAHALGKLGGPAKRPDFHAAMEDAQAVATGQRGEARSFHAAPKPGNNEAGIPAERGKLRLKADRS